MQMQTTIRYFFFSPVKLARDEENKKIRPGVGVCRDVGICIPCWSECTFVEHFWEGNLAICIKNL